MKFIIALLFIASCSKPPETTHSAGLEFKVDKLFTIDGCTVYRFEDSRTVYFTNCSGSTKYSETCGKNCTRDVVVD